MKINTKVRYGIKALVYIAEKTKEQNLIQIREISEAENISIQYLEQILFKLKKAEIIKGKRGPTGGYQLSKHPEEITLRELYSILEDENRVVDCNENTNECNDFEHECSTKCIWSKLDGAITKILEDTTLLELIKNKDKV